MIESKVVSLTEYHNLSGDLRSRGWTDDVIVDDSQFIAFAGKFTFTNVVRLTRG